MFKAIGAIGAFIIVALGLSYAFASWGTIEAGSRGIVLRLGAVTGEIKGEGFYTKTPWMEDVISQSIRTVKEEIQTECASKDLQVVTSTIATNMHLDQTQLASLWRTYGPGYFQSIVEPAIKETAKAVIAQYTAEELISKREVVREAITVLLRSKLQPTSYVETVNITNFNFSKSFNEAIEAKVTAEQHALAAKNKLAQVQFEAQQLEAAADGKAKAMKVESEALKSQPEILQLRALEKWDGHMPQYMSGQLPFIAIK